MFNLKVVLLECERTLISRVIGRKLKSRLVSLYPDLNRKGHSSAELMFGRKLRSQLVRLYPDLNRKAEAKQIREKECHDRGTKLCEFKIEDNVYLDDVGKTNGYLE